MVEKMVYRKNQCPQSCPKCDCASITEDHQEYTGNSIFRYYRCDDCDYEWSEEYKFSNWQPYEPIPLDISS